MTVNELLSFTAAIAAASLVGVVFFREGRSIANLAFVLGMTVLAIESALSGMRFRSPLAEDVLHWEYQRLLAMAFLPGAWLTFGLAYSRGNYREFLRRWRYALACASLAPLLLVFGFPRSVVLRAYPVVEGGSGYVVLGWAGTTLHVLNLCAAVLVLLNLERTFRASVGTMRWRIKFMIVGLGLLFAARLYSSSQSILYSGVDLSLGLVDSGALLLAAVLIARSLFRAGLLGVDVYPSRTVIQNSLTVLLAGVYLVSVGVFARLLNALGGETVFPLKSIGILLLAVLLTVLLLSDRVQRRIKQTVTRHFRRPEYDYRQVWMTFTERTGAATDDIELARAVTKWVSETFNALTVNLWLTDESRTQLRFAASTAFGEDESRSLLQRNKPSQAALAQIARLPLPVAIEGSGESAVRAIGRFNPVQFPEGGDRVCVPLAAADELMGVIVIGDRVGGVPFSMEDMDLMKCISDQVAGAVRRIELSQKLMQTRELEAFQTISTFFVHDLKNTASTLSLMLKNLPSHFHDPEFRQDALRSVGKTVDRINDLIGRLGLLRQKLELKPDMADLNRVIEGVLESLVKAHQLNVKKTLGALPLVTLDSEQIQKVLTNLVLNAKDALGADGQIEIQTFRQDGWAVISVSDNGCGMSPDFLARSLFRPFQTTKKKGIGIGMFHSRKIVEAHHGRIEVESQPGIGTTFRVLLPCDELAD